MTDLSLSERIRVALALNGEVNLKLNRPTAVALIRVLEREEYVADLIVATRASIIERCDRLDRMTLGLARDLWVTACLVVATSLAFGGLL